MRIKNCFHDVNQLPKIQKYRCVQYHNVFYLSTKKKLLNFFLINKISFDSNNRLIFIQFFKVVFILINKV